MKTRITELLRIDFPLVQGGLWGLAYAELCGPISEAGAFGQLTAAMHATPADLAREIGRTRALTAKPFGVNLPVHARDFTQYIGVAIAEGCAAFTLTGGDPSRYIEAIAGRVPAIVLVSSVRQARNAERAGADAVIAVGQEGGGNVGRADSGTLALVPQVVDALKIPVLAAGGIADGRGILAGLALGAEGIEMGSRFIAVRECRAADAYKEALCRAGDGDTAIVILPPDSRVRVLAEDAALLAGRSLQDLTAPAQGNPGFQPRGAGQSAGLIGDVPTAAELIARLRHEAQMGLARLHALMTDPPALH
ncbi:MAG: nitronate monooxygenase [Candidatus Hydrogenedentes bacterium]|nr:nitronate monooxygenase [Candidatus Hydrogenedentota bacterium]